MDLHWKPFLNQGYNNLILNFERMDDSIPGAYHLSVDKKGIYIAGDNETGFSMPFNR